MWVYTREDGDYAIELRTTEPLGLVWPLKVWSPFPTSGPRKYLIKLYSEDNFVVGNTSLFTVTVLASFPNLSPYQGDSDGVSVVSSDCTVNGGGRVNEEIPLCILSPDCELFICDGDNDSTDRYL